VQGPSKGQIEEVFCLQQESKNDGVARKAGQSPESHVIADIAVIGKAKAYTAEDAEVAKKWERRADPAAEGGCAPQSKIGMRRGKSFRYWDEGEGRPAGAGQSPGSHVTPPHPAQDRRESGDPGDRRHRRDRKGKGFYRRGRRGPRGMGAESGPRSRGRLPLHNPRLGCGA